MRELTLGTNHPGFHPGHAGKGQKGMSVRHLTGRVELSPQEQGFKERLSAAANAVEAIKANYDDELEARNAIVVEALDAGVTRGNAARWAKVDPARITQIVARTAG